MRRRKQERLEKRQKEQREKEADRAEDHADVKEVWNRTAEAMKALRSLELEARLMGRGKSDGERNTT